MIARRLQQSIHASIEPGVLNVFRVFTLVEWGLLSLGFLTLLNKPPRWPDAYATMLWALYTLTLLYLSWPWLAQTLGRAYLPLALIAVSVVPVVAQTADTLLHMAGGATGAAAQTDPARLYVWLLLPRCSSARSMACACCCSSPAERRCWRSRWRAFSLALVGRRSRAPRRTADRVFSSI